MRRLLLKLFRRRRLESDFETEVAFHRDMAAAHGNAIPFGNHASIKEQALDHWRFTFFENLWRDIAYGCRGLLRRPTLVLSAVLSLALGVGANTAIFSLAVEFLFSTPSVTDSGSLVYVRLGGNSHAEPRVLQALEDSGVFTSVSGENEEMFINWNDGSSTRQIFSVVTTKNYFTALGIPMAYGRGIRLDDANDVAVLAPDFWRRSFNADPSVVGRAIDLDGRPYTIVGILPASHRTLIGYGYSPDVYVPRYLENTVLAVYARLPPGMSLDQARARVTVVAARLDAAAPRPDFKYANDVQITPIAGMARLRNDGDAATIGLFFAALLVVVGLVLLIACVNVAGLLLAQASARKREMAIRLSLGATRGRLLQQLLVESLLLSLVGTATGFALAQALASLLPRLQFPVPLPIHLQIQTDWRVAAYAACLTIVSTLVCGLIPAWQSVKESIAPHLHRERKLRLRRILVAGQVAVSVVVLAAAFLFLRNLFQASAINPGFDVRRTVRAAVNLPPGSYKDAAHINAYVSRALDALQALPGIEAAAGARIVPFTDATRMGTDITLLGSNTKVATHFNWNAVTPDYFRAMDIPITEGRGFLKSDDGGSKVVVINRAFARQFPGDRVAAGTAFLWNETPYQIVGVAEGTKNMTIGEADSPQLYEPLTQIRNDRQGIQFVLRSTTPPGTQLAAVRGALRDIEPAAGLEVVTMASSIGFAFFPSQVGAALMSAVGALGLLLVAIGLYGTMAYSVTRRTREIGVRMAIGATRGDVARMVLLDAATMVGVGMALGFGVAWFITKPLAAFFVAGLTPTDPLSFLLVLAAMAMTALAAAWVPMNRATAINPTISLKAE